MCHYLTSLPVALMTAATQDHLLSFFCCLLVFFSTDKHILETTRHKYRQPWTALRMLSEGSPSVLRATLFTLRYRIKHLIFYFSGWFSIIQTENSSFKCVTVCVFFRLWLISSSSEKQTRCTTSVLNWNQTMLPHMSTRGRQFFPLWKHIVKKITCVCIHTCVNQ